MATAVSHHALITASRVRGTPVFNRQGERIGHVEDLSIDKVTGQVQYALLAFGGFLGLGDRFHPLPWSLLEYDTHRGGYVVPLDRPELEKTPHYAKDELESFGAGEHRPAAPFV
jgi:sporulation protein YlmC with PRC-barrel domain